MDIYIAILRGINVSGKNCIKMIDLKNLFEFLDFNHITTYIQSGNVIFTSEIKNKNQIRELISIQIEKTFSLKVPVLVLRIDDLREIISQNPFSTDKETSFIHFTFFNNQPDMQNIEIIEDKKAIGEEISITNKVAYVYCPDGYGKTKLNNNFLENKLKTVATTRNYKTTNELLKIAESI
ncbi:Uncharacterized conserved protein, DUF1697 family [Chishuiella changwenlii]|uniref:Uncharacterized conserved protein, DUF1697 family n=1 Tax=Chishuiella changwenlii TaxID=1434701 RepID=A0A1M7ALM7_9FLAO|nr:DUF1697 domain-containing protein [Chishuiella changwenlii]GGE90699.1 hypothetical protein GCM10010984_05530 [Chishuiella changwenlii]SHL43673.1 Uncharacterized conserved protein, DUF1697 family [Chishuiella changwenlii]